MAAPVFPARTDPLRRWHRLAPERTALVDRRGGRRLSYAELDTAADRWAGALRALGIGRGERVATLATARRELIEVFFGCGRLGAALVPLNHRLPPAELAPILADARPDVLLGAGRFRAGAEDALAAAGVGADEPRWVDFDADAPALLRDAGSDRPRAPAAGFGPGQPRLVLYTSGSTGRPKGVVIPRRQLLWNAIATTTAWELGPGDVVPVSTPLFHTGGWNVFATPLWHRGGTVVLMDGSEGFDPNRFLDVLADERCTSALVVPTQLRMLEQSERWGRELPALRFLISGGAPCPPALADRARAAGYRFRQGYGLTECGPNCFAISSEEAARRPGSVGWPVPYLEARLIAEDGSTPAPGEPGELLLRGPQMFGGYLNDPVRTAETLAPGHWLETGDLARRDADGAYSICGRRTQMYISGGENVFPGEVEAVLTGCEGVDEAVVIGVPHPRWGEVGRAYVVRGRAGVSKETVLAHVRERLAHYKAPKSIAFVDEIPRLGSGKPDRRALAADPGAERPSRAREDG